MATRRKKMILRTTLSATFALSTALVASASAANVKVNIGYATAADYLPAFVAKENGCFAANGIDAQLTRMPVTTNIPAAVIADTLQIGAQTATLFLPAVDNGLDLVAIAGGTRLRAAMRRSAWSRARHFKSKPVRTSSARKSAGRASTASPMSCSGSD
jgi:ABC-type nitrate/sulfonate/bicarbonate transport system substrate-binding protein